MFCTLRRKWFSDQRNQPPSTVVKSIACNEIRKILTIVFRSGSIILHIWGEFTEGERTICLQLALMQKTRKNVHIGRFFRVLIYILLIISRYCREEGIRTLDTVTRILPFQGSSFNHSDTSL